MFQANRADRKGKLRAKAWRIEAPLGCEVKLVGVPITTVKVQVARREFTLVAMRPELRVELHGNHVRLTRVKFPKKLCSIPIGHVVVHQRQRVIVPRY